MILNRKLFRSLRMYRNYSSETSEVKFRTSNDIGTITLNKPKALNSLNLGMVCQIVEKLREWESCMKLVMVRGTGKAFCAGGDVVSITKQGPSKAQDGKDFFRTEYTMNYLIGTYKIPYMAILDGITMGGGVGLSVHGRYRIATENTLFAMPETAIGLFPDVGGSYFLPRLPGSLGNYLALTGARLKGTDVAKVGIATHYIESARLPEIFDGLENGKISTCDLDNVLKKMSKDLSAIPLSLESNLDSINKIFRSDNIECIFEKLEELGDSWSMDTTNELEKMSPTSLKITLKEIAKGKNMNLKQCLEMEYRLATATLDARISKDFYEGVRALLIDKDKKPKWCPRSVLEVSDQKVDEIFEPCGPENELQL